MRRYRDMKQFVTALTRRVTDEGPTELKAA
jgi:hypothetical protein